MAYRRGRFQHEPEKPSTVRGFAYPVAINSRGTRERHQATKDSRRSCCRQDPPFGQGRAPDAKVCEHVFRTSRSQWFRDRDVPEVGSGPLTPTMPLVCSACVPCQPREPPTLSPTGGREFPCSPSSTSASAAVSSLNLPKGQQMPYNQPRGRQRPSSAYNVAGREHDIAEQAGFNDCARRFSRLR
jgi:hypothetical protein